MTNLRSSRSEVGLEPEQVAWLDSVFPGALPSRKPPTSYWVSMLPTALAIVFLPMIYLALVAASAWGTWYYFSEILPQIEYKGAGRRLGFFWWLFLIAIGIGGAMLTLFLVKPIFAPVGQRHATRLNQASQPLLFGFIGRICDRVEAPRPVAIEFDAELNASAGFRSGPLGMIRGELVLCIGLPLVAILSGREFAGVLAHEFGHFRQGFGMRLTFLIRSVNHWLARVAWERDAWDDALHDFLHNADIDAVYRGLAVIPIGLIWISRLLLKGLALLGHAISCVALRQMEFDADNSEVALAGAETFEQTTQKMTMMGSVLQRAWFKIRANYDTQRTLPDDLCTRYLQEAHEMKPETIEEILREMESKEGSLLSTHPTGQARIEHARALGWPGAFEGEFDASELFEEFEVLSKIATRSYYEEEMEIYISDQTLVPVGESRRMEPEVPRPQPEQKQPSVIPFTGISGA